MIITINSQVNNINLRWRKKAKTALKHMQFDKDLMKCTYKWCLNADKFADYVSSAVLIINY